jgi:hypothetical protein
MTNAVQDEARQIQEAVDMRRSLGSEYSNMEGFLFQDLTDTLSPGRRRVMIWSMESGEPISIRRYRLEDYLMKRDARGRKRFTAKQEEAPEYVLGQYKCFLAEGSEQREDGSLRAAGLAARPFCPAEHLASPYSVEQHAKGTHKAEWRMYSDYLERIDHDADREAQKRQLDAMMALARQAADNKEIVDIATSGQKTCPDCGWRTPMKSQNSGASLNIHMKRHCPFREGAPVEQEASAE